MVEFLLPKIVDCDTWGPPPLGDLEPGVLDFNVEHLDKYPMSRVGRVCDFSVSGQRFAEQRAAKGKAKGLKGKGKDMIIPEKDDQGFELVHNQPLPGKSFGRGRGGKKGKGKGLQANYQEGILGQKQKPLHQGQGDKGKGKGKGKGAQRGRGIPSFKEWSVETKTEWNMMQEIMLSSLAKLQINAKEVEYNDTMWCGTLPTYSKVFDRAVTVKAEKPLRRFEDLNFFNVSTSDDPILPEYLQSDQEISVIATDHILACLIAAGRSVYSWDIVVTKVSNRLIFDKRDGSPLDFLSVNETAIEPPSNDDATSMNAPMKLGQEASCINQNFSQMVLDESVEAEYMENPNPFEEEGEGPAASGAYRYRKITLPGNPKDEREFNQKPVTMMVRTEVSCRMPSEGSDSYASVKALNEFPPKTNQSWRTHLESQRGAVLAQELKNNAFKLARWTAEAILGGCDVLKLGYVSRSNQSDPWNHSVLGVQTYNTEGFADQIGMSRNNAFGILRSLIDLIMAYEDGKYLILKDPTKAVMRIYEVPWETFDEPDGDEEEEEEDEDDGVELDADGNRPVERPEGPGMPRRMGAA